MKANVPVEILQEMTFHELRATAMASAVMLSEMWAASVGLPNEAGLARFNFEKYSALIQHGIPENLGQDLEDDLRRRFQRLCDEGRTTLTRLAADAGKDVDALIGPARQP